MKLFLAAGMMLTAVACSTSPAGEVSSGPDIAGACRPEAIADLIGRPATQELGADAMRRSGARRLRWIRPGDAVTMDYIAERLNIHLDARHRVERFACG